MTWLCACDTATDPVEDDIGFLFRIEVKDSEGKPVTNLRISGYNELSNIDPFFSDAEFTSPPEPTATTSIHTVVAVKSQVDVSIYDLNRQLIAILSDTVLAAGTHRLIWSPGREPFSGIYECRMTARDTLSGEMIFEDLMYPVKWTADPEVSVYGYTDSEGIYQTANELMFPNVLENVPTLIQTNAIAEELGTFAFEDTVVLTITDTALDDTMRIRRVVRPGRNVFAIVWDPGSPAPATHRADEPPYPAKAVSVDSDIDPPDLEWSLRQNYPNPFN
ncbi:MAG: hypothetical protein JSW50_10615 [Candidatus Latescibacterota bacterium]|nr:MAG: hypothetical protein JSW50_10615 [Candidatus Latescibacterota bacterium]